MTTDSSMNDVDSANGDVMVSTDLTGRGTPTIYGLSLFGVGEWVGGVVVLVG